MVVLHQEHHAAENCPVIPSKNATTIHHNFTDPSKLKGTEDEVKAAFRSTREEIKLYCKDFTKSNLAG